MAKRLGFGLLVAPLTCTSGSRATADVWDSSPTQDDDVATGFTFDTGLVHER